MATETNDKDNDCLPVDGLKKRKISAADDKKVTSLFSKFNVEKILREDRKHKLITLQGSFVGEKDDDEKGDSKIKSTAVVLLERKPFHSETLQNYLRDTESVETLNNDVYTTHDVFPHSVCADVKATVIHPATDKHIAKYSDHEPFLIHETQALYETVTLPCLSNSKFSIQWVYNILQKKTESERIVVEDPNPETGFVMLPDMKWDGTNMESLYLIAIVHKHGLRSLRDLRKEHLPLLKNILEKGQTSIQSRFQVPPHKLRVYLHYQPSYYHLHVHFTHLKADPPGSEVTRAHLIQDVIENLEADSDFYGKKTLTYVVRDNDDLYLAYKEYGYLK